MVWVMLHGHFYACAVCLQTCLWVCWWVGAHGVVVVVVFGSAMKGRKSNHIFIRTKTKHDLQSQCLILSMNMNNSFPKKA